MNAWRHAWTTGLLLAQLCICAADWPPDLPPPNFDKNVSPGDGARVFPCYRASKPITIDGKLNEDDWIKAPPQKFVRHWAANEKEREPAHGATVRMLWDDDYFYFAGELDDEDLFADVTKHDGPTWTNDSFELFIKPNPNFPTYYEFHVTPANVTTDIKYPYPGAKPNAPAWDSHMLSAVQLQGTLNKRDDKDKGWTVEVRIPWSDFAEAGGAPKDGERCAFCAGRYDYTGKAEPVNSATALLTKCHFHRVQEYDWVEFSENDPTEEDDTPAGKAAYGRKSSRKMLMMNILVMKDSRGEWRTKHLDNLDNFKASVVDKELKFAADYFRAFAVWRREDHERIYQPYDTFKRIVTQMRADYPAFADDVRTQSLELRLHHPEYGNKPEEERVWMLKFIKETIPALKYYNEAETLKGEITEAKLTLDAVTLLAEFEAYAAPDGKHDKGAVFEATLKRLEDGTCDKALELGRANKPAVLKAIELAWFRSVKFEPTVKADEIAAAAGDPNSLSSDERRKELKNKLKTLDRDHAYRYLLWLSGDGLKKTICADADAKRDFLSELQTALYDNRDRRQMTAQQYEQLAVDLRAAHGADYLISFCEVGVREENERAGKK